MEKKIVHRIVGTCGVLVIALVLWGFMKLAWWFVAPIAWKFASGRVPADRTIAQALR